MSLIRLPWRPGSGSRVVVRAWFLVLVYGKPGGEGRAGGSRRMGTARPVAIERGGHLPALIDSWPPPRQRRVLLAHTPPQPGRCGPGNRPHIPALAGYRTTGAAVRHHTNGMKYRCSIDAGPAIGHSVPHAPRPTYEPLRRRRGGDLRPGGQLCCQARTPGRASISLACFAAPGPAEARSTRPHALPAERRPSRG